MSHWVAGADGCPSGWFRAARDVETGTLAFALCRSALELLTVPPAPSILCIDIPIGLTEEGPRGCDRQARELLKPRRHASVFPAPIRPALGARSHEHASQLTQAADGRRVSAQAWNIYGKIREVDALFDTPQARDITIAEAHPEVSFAAWSGAPMPHPKKSREGRIARFTLADRWLGRGQVETARDGHRKSDLADDDILDAIAALWTACRLHSGHARFLQNSPSHDARGRPMRIVY